MMVALAAAKSHSLLHRIMRLIRDPARLRRIIYIWWTKLLFADLSNETIRLQFAAHLEGEGIEIGALYKPLEVDRARARVRYVDVAPLEQLEKWYPEINPEKLITPDLVMPADNLHQLPSDSQDFVIGNCLLEHLDNPIKALLEWHRVLKPGGRLYLTIPDKRATTDKFRKPIPMEHYARDYEEGPDVSLDEHLYDWAVHSWFLTEPKDIENSIKHLKATGYPIHYHCFLPSEGRQLIGFINQRFGADFTIEKFRNTQFKTNEFLMLLRKGPSKG